MIRATVLLVVTLAAASAHAGFDDDYSCDRTGDSKVTSIDALVALQEAVDTCKRGLDCDSNGDYEATASDALALLRYAVGMPEQLECSCIYFDECFEDDDCAINGYPPGYFCAGYLCAQCDYSAQCGDGEICDPCSLTCQPGQQ